MTSSRAELTPRKRILLVTPDFPPYTIGGGAMVCQQLATEYSRQGWDVTVLSMDTSKAGLFARPEEVRAPAGRVTFLPMATRMETSGVSLLLVVPPSIPGMIRLLREFRREPWDAVHLHGNPSFLVDAMGLLCRIAMRPQALTFHGAIGDPTRFGRMGGALYRALIGVERRIFASATAITAVSGTTLNEVRLLGFHALRMVTIPNAGFLTPSGAESGENEPSGVLARWGLERGNFALCLGAFMRRKGQDLLLSAFTELAARRALPETLQLVFAGFERDPAFSAELRRIVTNTGLESRVRLVGEVTESEKHGLLRAARWVIMPSRYEASPVLAFEAMAIGCVLVVPDLPNFQEIVGEGPNAVTFHAGDSYSLSQALADLAREPERESAIHIAALRRSQSFATWPDVARAYLDLFSDPSDRSG